MLNRETSPDGPTGSRPTLLDPDFARNFFRQFSRSDTAEICKSIEQISVAFEARKFKEAREVFRTLIGSRDKPLKAEELKWLLNTPYQLNPIAEDNSILFKVVEKNAGARTLKLFFAHGLSSEFGSELINYVEIEGKWEPERFQGNNVAHYAAFCSNLDALRELKECGYDFNLKNSEGLTPLTLFMRVHSTCNTEDSYERSVFEYLVANSDKATSFSTKEHPVEVALAIGNIEFARSLSLAGFAPPRAMQNRKFIIERDGQEYQVGYSELALEVLELHKLFGQNESVVSDRMNPEHVAKESIEFYEMRGNLYHHYLYLHSYFSATNQIASSGRSFARLATVLYNDYPLDSVWSLLADIESFQDGVYYDDIEGQFTPDYHPNESEFLLLLAHPDLISSFDHKLAGSVTRTLTAAYRYWDFDEKTIRMQDHGWQTITNWQRIGQLNNIHLHWRFDSIQPKDPESGQMIVPSIMEEYGFEKVRRPKKYHDIYGATFLLRPHKVMDEYEVTRAGITECRKCSAKAVIIISRANIIISDPEQGTLIIRNSSLVFGRDTMSHPAYYSKKAVSNGLTLADLSQSDILEKKAGFLPLLDRRINGVKHNNTVTVQRSEEIMSLIDLFTAFEVDYNKWKFNTDPRTAFRKKDDGSFEVLGAYNSSGFQFVVRNLHLLSEIAKKSGRPELLPDLAFYPAFEPPWNAHKFTIPALGAEKPVTSRRFKLDFYALEVLIGLTQDEYNYPDFFQSGLQAFFQAGITARANLLLVAPQKDSKI